MQIHISPSHLPSLIFTVPYNFIITLTLSLFLLTSEELEIQGTHSETNSVEATCNQMLVLPYTSNLHKPVYHNHTC